MEDDKTLLAAITGLNNSITRGLSRGASLRRWSGKPMPDGSVGLEEWFLDVADYCTRNEGQNEAHVILDHLDGAAKVEAACLGADIRSDAEKLRTALRARFGQEWPVGAFFNRVQGPTEAVGEYLCQLQRLYDGMVQAEKQQLQSDSFKNGRCRFLVNQICKGLWNPLARNNVQCQRDALMGKSWDDARSEILRLTSCVNETPQPRVREYGFDYPRGTDHTVVQPYYAQPYGAFLSAHHVQTSAPPSQPTVEPAASGDSAIQSLLTRLVDGQQQLVASNQQLASAVANLHINPGGDRCDRNPGYRDRRPDQRGPSSDNQRERGTRKRLPRDYCIKNNLCFTCGDSTHKVGSCPDRPRRGGESQFNRGTAPSPQVQSHFVQPGSTPWGFSQGYVPHMGGQPTVGPQMSTPQMSVPQMSGSHTGGYQTGAPQMMGGSNSYIHVVGPQGTYVYPYPQEQGQGGAAAAAISQPYPVHTQYVDQTPVSSSQDARYTTSQHVQGNDISPGARANPGGSV